MKAVFVLAVALLLVSSLEAASLPKSVQTVFQGVQNTLVNAVATSSSPAHVAVAAAESDGDESEVAKKLRQQFDELLEKTKDAIEHGKTIREDTLEKLNEIRPKLNDQGTDIGLKAKELLQQTREKEQNLWAKILERYTR